MSTSDGELQRRKREATQQPDQAPPQTPNRGVRHALTNFPMFQRSEQQQQQQPQHRFRSAMRVPRKHRQETVDQEKSTELMSELSWGMQPALLLASMFQRDEHGGQRIPVLLEQLKVKVTDSQVDSNSTDRHLDFRIELEYGNGPTRMSWVIHRTWRDFANLHIKYKLQIGTQKYIQMKGRDKEASMPRFPKSALPYLRGVRGLEEHEVDDEEDEGEEPNGDDTTLNERSSRRRKRRSIIGMHRRYASMPNPKTRDSSASPSRPASIAPTRRETYSERQRKKLEAYLKQLINFLMFKPDSNRLCKFLELSSLGIRLAAEGSYHGKEGFLVIQSSKGLDFRSGLNFSMIKSRHTPKWFLVRQSYIVCVDSPTAMHIYDVFLVDSDFRIQEKSSKRLFAKEAEDNNSKASSKENESAKHHTLKIRNSERKLRLLARTERQLHQFEDSIRTMLASTPWSRVNRFDSFAPVRPNCFAQWLVDGRDHMWMVSRAINQARDVIYIHDWWLSPELYMRRPAAISQKWRLDRLLQKKAKQGVKVFVIVYRNINSAIPIDSEYTKFSLLDLHPNVFVQRSPNQFRQNTFFWAHHEKVCIVDHNLAFVGGVDLCFGRWDTPQHLVTDDKLTGFEPSDLPKDSDHCQLWPGKDYSNPRIQDFYDLDKPYEEMYDRERIPRMPWHDVAMQVIGQPARDLTRHFVQRWNFILRQRKPTRPTPFLLPPPDFNHADLEALELDGTCEVQILRSASQWSLGINTTEHSIMNAYVKLIEQSEHFVYMENQFFITSCDIGGKKIKNVVGDALVERIIRAHEQKQNWKAIILIPLVPGFQNPVDTEGGTSVRLIMMCQYRSICRGETSIFARLRAHGIEPEKYIQFYSLRSWGKIGQRKVLVTEQLYIHAKILIVDDRAALIASANVNERSMLGDRDSECGSLVRDTDLINSTMDGKPYLVGRFPHTLRMRLMREHIGIDVDELLEEEMSNASDIDSQRSPSPSVSSEEGYDGDREARLSDHDDDDSGSRPDSEQSEDDGNISPGHAPSVARPTHSVNDGGSSDDEVPPLPSHPQELPEPSSSSEKPEKPEQPEVLASRLEHQHSFNHDADVVEKVEDTKPRRRRVTSDPRVTDNPQHRRDVDGYGPDRMKAADEPDLRDSYVDDEGSEHLAARPSSQTSKTASNAAEGPIADSSGRRFTHSDFRKYVKNHGASASDYDIPGIDEDCMKDPVSADFGEAIWRRVARQNTELYRKVFRCMPDSEVKYWHDYKEYLRYASRFENMQKMYYYNENIRVKQDGPSTAALSTEPEPEPDPVTKPQARQSMQGDTLATSAAPTSVGQHDPDEEVEPENLRKWAEDANKAQMERERKEFHRRQSTSMDVDVDVADAASSPSALLSPVLQQQQQQQEGAKQKPPGSSNAPASPKSGDGSPSTRPLSAQVFGALSPQSEASSQHGGKQRKKGASGPSLYDQSRRWNASDDIVSVPEAEELLRKVQGHLIEWPYDWLEREEQENKWLFALDQISPLEIYD